MRRPLDRRSPFRLASSRRQRTRVQVAFCDTFEHAAASNSSRSGALNPTVWGVSEISALDNPSQGKENEFVRATAPKACGGGSVLPPENVQICNGHLFDTADDGGSQTVVGMYPRQPFDIAGRTGDVTFDVSNDTLGPHAAWPAFVYTDQPVPAPYQHAAAIEPRPNSFGFTMDGASEGGCPSGQWTVGFDVVTRDYALDSIGPGTSPDGTFAQDGCVTESTNPAVMSHVEVQISVNQVTVWASDAGTSHLIKIAELDGANLPLTRGLIWLEDAHYNAGKYPPGQRNNTFGWGDVGFDGPILPRDRGFDVGEQRRPRRARPEYRVELGRPTVSVHTLPVPSASLKHAKGALVEFNWFADAQTVPTVSLNGHAPISTAWPFSQQFLQLGKPSRSRCRFGRWSGARTRSRWSRPATPRGASPTSTPSCREPAACPPASIPRAAATGLGQRVAGRSAGTTSFASSSSPAANPSTPKGGPNSIRSAPPRTGRPRCSATWPGVPPVEPVQHVIRHQRRRRVEGALAKERAELPQQVRIDVEVVMSAPTTSM